MRKISRVIKKSLFFLLLLFTIFSLYIVGIIREQYYICINSKCITFVEYRNGGMDDVFFRIYFQKIYLESLLPKNTTYIDLPRTETAYLLKRLKDGKFILYGEPFTFNGNINNNIIFKNQYSKEIYDYRNVSKEKRPFYFINELSLRFTF